MSEHAYLFNCFSMIDYIDALTSFNRS